MNYTERDDPLAAARGVVNGILISIPIWAFIALVVWALW